VLNQYKQKAHTDFLSRRFASKEGGEKPLEKDSCPRLKLAAYFTDTVCSKADNT